MITIRKLLSLPRGTRERKLISLLHDAERSLSTGRSADRVFLAELLSIVARDEELPEGIRSSALQCVSVLRGGGEEVVRAVNAVRHGILAHLGTEPSDWDLFSPSEADASVGVRTGHVLPFRVYLDDIRSPFNVGSIFRTAECFAAERIFLSPGTPLPTHPRALRTAMGTSSVIPWEVKPLESLSAEENVFALELGGAPLGDFRFPERGTVIVGSEELGVSPLGRRIAEAGAGRVSIPMGGLKASLNVSVAFGILMQAWFASARP